MQLVLKKKITTSMTYSVKKKTRVNTGQDQMQSSVCIATEYSRTSDSHPIIPSGKGIHFQT